MMLGCRRPAAGPASVRALHMHLVNYNSQLFRGWIEAGISPMYGKSVGNTYENDSWLLVVLVKA